MIDEAKKQYVDNLVNKLNDPNTSQKTFWSAFSKFLNKKKNTVIPPLESNGNYITNVNEKQAYLMTNLQNSALPWTITLTFTM